MSNLQFLQQRLHRTRTKVAFGLTLLLCVLLAAIAVPAYAGKPSPPAAPPVYYEVNVLGNGAANDMNEAGIIVGQPSPPRVASIYYMTPGGPVMGNLNAGANLIDLDSPDYPVPIENTGWVATRATGIT